MTIPRPKDLPILDTPPEEPKEECSALFTPYEGLPWRGSDMVGTPTKEMLESAQRGLLRQLDNRRKHKKV